MIDLTDQAIRLQVLLERVKAGENRKLDEFLREVDALLRDRLGRASLTAVQRDRVEALLAEIREALAELQGRAWEGVLDRLDDLAGIVADTETKALAAALDGFDTNVPRAAVIRAAVLSAPLSVRGAGGGLLLGKFIAKHNEATLERVEGVIRRGFYEGRTTEQIVRDLRGTKAANYADGIIGETRRHARTVAHTALQHVAHVARAETWKANADIVEGYRWVSTLDSRTSDTCQSLDGQVFEVGEGPMPPIHPNCRSTVVPVMKTWRALGINIDEMPDSERASVNGPVSASLTYFEWLKTQPASFVEEALGTVRAELFLRGGVSADEFARLQLGKNFQPLTLDEMRAKAPKVFERAGV
jgi:SPP1 gp7 family putative phage head morphogenesis protein